MDHFHRKEVKKRLGLIPNLLLPSMSQNESKGPDCHTLSFIENERRKNNIIQKVDSKQNLFVVQYMFPLAHRENFELVGAVGKIAEQWICRCIYIHDEFEIEDYYFLKRPSIEQIYYAVQLQHIENIAKYYILETTCKECHRPFHLLDTAGDFSEKWERFIHRICCYD